MIPKDVQKLLPETEIGMKVDWNSHLESMPCPTWIGDADGQSVHINLACRRLLGVASPEELAEQGWEEHIHPNDRKRYVKSWDLFVSGLRESFEEFVRWIRPDTGETVPLAVRAQRLAGGQFQGWARLAQAELALNKLKEISRVRPRGAESHQTQIRSRSEPRMHRPDQAVPRLNTSGITHSGRLARDGTPKPALASEFTPDGT